MSRVLMKIAVYPTTRYEVCGVDGGHHDNTTPIMLKPVHFVHCLLLCACMKPADSEDPIKAILQEQSNRISP